MRFFSLLFSSLVLTSSISLAQTYRWIDENGVVSYSQTPPPSLKADTLNIKPQPQGDNSEATRKLNALRQKLEDQREDRQLSKENAEKAIQEDKSKKANCVSARSNLRKLEGLGNRLLKAANGEYVRLTEEERQQRIKDTQEHIRTNCSE